MQSSSCRVFRRARLPAIIMAMGGVLLATPAFAQPQQEGEGFTGLEEIIVTAQRRRESLQDVPISVVAFTADTLEHRGVVNTIALPEVVPSVKYTSSGPSGMFFIRGVGNTNAGLGEEGANAFYVDGVFMPDLLQSVLMFNNIDRVEVLKGPQGTLFGRNSSGGLVHVITREPEQETEANIKVGYANYDKVTTQAYLGGGLTDTLAADIAISTADQGDGWGKNLTTGSDVGKTWHGGVRSKVVWTPTDSAKFTLAGDYMKLSSDTSNLWRLAPGSTGMGWPPGPDTVRTPPPGNEFHVESNDPINTRLRVAGASLTAEFDLDWATLTSITAARNLTNDSGIDVDAGPQPLLGITLDSETSSFQQEFRLASNEIEPFSWQAGVFFLRSTAELTGTETSGLLLQGAMLSDFVEQTVESIAIFGEASYTLTPATRVTVGLRYTQDEIDLDARRDTIVAPIGVVDTQIRKDSATDEEMTWRLALRHDLSDNVNVYASYNRGFKSGLFTVMAAPWQRVEPQTIEAFEVGLKSEWLDNRLRLNAAAFRYEIDDYQVRAVTGVGNSTLLNAAEVEVDGLEIEFEAAPSDGLSLFGSATWLKSEFSDFPNAPTYLPSPGGGGIEQTINAKGHKTPLAPSFAGNVGASYSLPVDTGELRVTGVYSYSGSYYFESDNRLKQPSYAIFNASVAWNPAPNWGIELWGRNLTDKRHYVQQTGQLTGDWAARAAPRTCGVNVSYSY